MSENARYQNVTPIKGVREGWEPPDLGGGGEPPDNTGMEARMTRVETKLDHIEKEVSNFKWWVVAQIVAALLTVVGTGIAIQQMTVATFQAAKEYPAPAPGQQPIIINIPTPQAPQGK